MTFPSVSRIRFDRTYEELKQRWADKFSWVVGIRFDRTYEELKHPKKLQIGQKVRVVLIVPMRS